MSHDRDRYVYVLFPVVLLPVEADLVPEERRGKKNLVSSLNSSGGKLIVILLTDIFALHVRLSAVYVWRTGF